MKKIKKALTRLDAFASQADVQNTGVSAGSVGWHIAHSHLVVQSIVAAMKASTPNDYKWACNIKRTAVMLTGRLPRGKAKAPDRVQPLQAPTRESLKQAADKTRAALLILENLPANAHFKHPFFGVLNKKAAVRTLQIHTNHHIGIVLDILAVKS